jgi:uncharacterized nucleotidyltransferase DUF6036
MHRGDLQHVIFEVGRRFDLKEIFIIGSAAILAAMPEPPEGELTASRDVDIIPPGDDNERLADQISFVLGEASAFDEEFGYHAQGVSLRTPTYAPAGWQTRTIAVCVETYVGHCMEPHDLVLSKLGAGREKDIDFAQAVAKLKLVHQDVLLDRLKLVQATEEHSGLMAARITALFK